MNNLLKLLGLIGTYGYLTKPPQDDENYISDKELMEAENEQRKKSEISKAHLNKLNATDEKYREDQKREEELRLKLEALRKAQTNIK
jgi:hypothetical protein